MCRWLSNILFPTEVIGRKRQCAKYILPNISGWHVMQVKATGKRIHMSVSYEDAAPNITVPLDIVDVNDQTVGVVLENVQYIRNRLIYFNCIDVKSLVVNGEQLI